MRTIFYTILIILVITGCDKTQKVYSKYDSGQNKLVGIKLSATKECFISYYETGVIEVKYCTDDSVYDGQYQYYYPSGKLKFIEYYSLGVLENGMLSYYENGMLKERARRENGMREGVYIMYDSIGREVLYKYYEKGLAYYERETSYMGGEVYSTGEVIRLIVRPNSRSEYMGMDCLLLKLPVIDSMTVDIENCFVKIGDYTFKKLVKELPHPRLTFAFDVNQEIKYCPDSADLDSALIYGDLYYIEDNLDTTYLSSFEEVLHFTKIKTSEM
jgi:hypothetical protein